MAHRYISICPVAARWILRIKIEYLRASKSNAYPNKVFGPVFSCNWVAPGQEQRYITRSSAFGTSNGHHEPMY
jgi:hypothetical protein